MKMTVELRSHEAAKLRSLKRGLIEVAGRKISSRASLRSTFNHASLHLLWSNAVLASAHRTSTDAALSRPRMPGSTLENAL
jgi:hypothetical protein